MARILPGRSHYLHRSPSRPSRHQRDLIASAPRIPAKQQLLTPASGPKWDPPPPGRPSCYRWWRHASLHAPRSTRPCSPHPCAAPSWAAATRAWHPAAFARAWHTSPSIAPHQPLRCQRAQRALLGRSIATSPRAWLTRHAPPTTALEMRGNRQIRVPSLAFRISCASGVKSFWFQCKARHAKAAIVYLSGGWWLDVCPHYPSSRSAWVGLTDSPQVDNLKLLYIISRGGKRPGTPNW